MSIMHVTVHKFRVMYSWMDTLVAEEVAYNWQGTMYTLVSICVAMAFSGAAIDFNIRRNISSSV